MENEVKAPGPKYHHISCNEIAVVTIAPGIKHRYDDGVANAMGDAIRKLFPYRKNMFWLMLSKDLPKQCAMNRLPREGNCRSTVSLNEPLAFA